MTQKLFSVKLKNGPSDWINLCTKIDFVNEEITYIANGVKYYKGPHTSVKAKNDMVITSVEILDQTGKWTKFRPFCFVGQLYDCWMHHSVNPRHNTTLY